MDYNKYKAIVKSHNEIKISRKSFYLDFLFESQTIILFSICLVLNSTFIP